MKNDVFYEDTDRIYFDDNIVNNAILAYDKLQTGFDSMSQDINKGGAINKRTGLFGNGITKIGRQSNAISHRYNGVKNIASNGKDKWIMLENKLKSEISSLEIPIFEALNSTNLNSAYNNVKIGKEEGKAINSDATTFATEEFDSVIGTKKELDDITNDNVISTSELDDTFNSVNEVQLVDGLGSSKVQKSEVDDSLLDVDKVALNNINNGIASTVQNFDDDFVNNKVTLENINNNATNTKEEFDDNYEHLVQ